MRRIYPCLATGLIAVVTAGGATAANVPKPRRYAGHTSQGLPITLKVAKNGRSISGRLREEDNCPSLGMVFTGAQAFQAPLPKSRKLAGGYEDSADLPDDATIGAGDLTYTAHHTVRLKLGVKTAVGVWHTQLTVLDGSHNPVAQCDSGRVSFKLKAAGR